MQFDCDSRSNLRSRKVEIDIDKRTLGYKDKKKISKEDLKFSRLFLSKLNENDYQLLYKNHFAYKNKISNNAPLEIIEGYFDYQQVEQDGLMYALPCTGVEIERDQAGTWHARPVVHAFRRRSKPSTTSAVANGMSR